MRRSAVGMGERGAVPEGAALRHSGPTSCLGCRVGIGFTLDTVQILRSAFKNGLVRLLGRLVAGVTLQAVRSRFSRVATEGADMAFGVFNLGIAKAARFFTAQRGQPLLPRRQVEEVGLTVQAICQPAFLWLAHSCGSWRIENPVSRPISDFLIRHVHTPGTTSRGPSTCGGVIKLLRK